MRLTQPLPAQADFPKQLTQVRAAPTLLAIGLDWFFVAAAISAATAFPHLLTFLAAQVIVATRQHALFLIMHEGAHGTIAPNRFWNDKISNLLASWPVGFSTESYRERHWQHHRYLNSDQDPDWARKAGSPNWQFPMTARRFWTQAFVYLLGKGVLEVVYALKALGVRKRDWPVAIPYFTGIALTITLLGGWKLFALYWALPYFTLMPLLHRLRYASEHLALPWRNLLDNARDVLCSPVERFLFSPHYANYHLVHHAYPFIPWHQLPAAHRFLTENYAGWRERARKNEAYFFGTVGTVYGDLTSNRPVLPGEAKDGAQRSQAA